VNKDKRHAFVKMISRKDAVTAKEAMEKNKVPDSQLRVNAIHLYCIFEKWY
jgi:protein NRD1